MGLRISLSDLTNLLTIAPPQTIGDCFMVAFKSPLGAVQAATDIQLALHNAQWDPALERVYTHIMADRDEEVVLDEVRGIRGLRVRIGLQIAVPGSDIKPKKDPVTTGYDYYGTAVNVAARMEAKAFGGEVLITQELVDHIGQSEMEQRFFLEPQGTVQLKGVEGGKMAWRVLPQALSRRALPERSPEEEGAEDSGSDDDSQDHGVSRLIDGEAKRLGLARQYLQQQVCWH